MLASRYRRRTDVSCALVKSVSGATLKSDFASSFKGPSSCWPGPTFKGLEKAFERIFKNF